ncbi:MAG: hypothetical protein RL738_827, partial [Bacteroidota bacterium]
MKYAFFAGLSLATGLVWAQNVMTPEL